MAIAIITLSGGDEQKRVEVYYLIAGDKIVTVTVYVFYWVEVAPRACFTIKIMIDLSDTRHKPANVIGSFAEHPRHWNQIQKQC